MGISTQGRLHRMSTAFKPRRMVLTVAQLLLPSTSFSIYYSVTVLLFDVM
jgi:hypothetical protein